MEFHFITTLVYINFKKSPTVFRWCGRRPTLMGRIRKKKSLGQTYLCDTIRVCFCKIGANIALEFVIEAKLLFIGVLFNCGDNVFIYNLKNS